MLIVHGQSFLFPYARRPLSACSLPIARALTGVAVEPREPRSEPNPPKPNPLKLNPETPTQLNVSVELVPMEKWPSELDEQRFSHDSTVSFWREYDDNVAARLGAFTSATAYGGGSPLLQSTGLASALWSEAASSDLFSDATSLAYWTYHTCRAGFFASQGLASVVAHQLYVSLQQMGKNVKASAGAANASGGTYLQRIMKNPRSEVVWRSAEAFGVFMQDLQFIRKGTYKLPWDMDTPRHRQYNPLYLGRRSLQFIREAVATLDRRTRGQEDSVWMSSAMFPAYYQGTFHYQTDGWLSSRSAAVYEFSTEVLFWGRQDAMQRSVLVPLRQWADAQRAAGVALQQCRLLEVAAGTGRLHTFIKDNYPTLPSIVSDLSPFYLERARSNLQYWKRLRAAGRKLGGTDDTGCSFLQAAAENLGLPDASCDVVVCVYLFHELPPDTREAVAREMFRVLRPGGKVILADSVQLGDRPKWDVSLPRFGDFNEPHFRDYVAADLGKLFMGAGFTCGAKMVSSSTKTLTFDKL